MELSVIIIILFTLACIACYNYIKQKRQREKIAEIFANSDGDGDGDGDGDADNIIETLKRQTAEIEAFIQAGLVGDQKTVDAINEGTYEGPLPEKRYDGGWLSIYDNLRILKIAGINHRQGITRYTGRVECALVPEPTNEFDPDAIKIVAEDSHHLGYIPSNQTDFVRSLAGDTFPYRCTAMIHEMEDEDDSHKFFVGFVYVTKKDNGR